MWPLERSADTIVSACVVASPMLSAQELPLETTGNQFNGRQLISDLEVIRWSEPRLVRSPIAMTPSLSTIAPHGLSQA
jgi:hypothetical protein